MDAASLLVPDNVRRWAYSTDLGEGHEKAHVNGGGFEYDLAKALTMDLLWGFASDLTCCRRQWFLGDYVKRIAFIYRRDRPLLPFSFSRLCGWVNA